MATLRYNKLQQAKAPVPAHRSEHMRLATAPHVESFNMMVRESLPLAVMDLLPQECIVNERRVGLRL